MNILFIVTAHNSMSQRAYAELTDMGHDISVHIADTDKKMIKAVEIHNPDIIIAPFLKKIIPQEIWSKHTCMIVHPGVKGDRGPSSLDWAIFHDIDEWGVTLLQANGEKDGGDIWASHNFKMRKSTKSDIYRHEIANAAIKGIIETIEKFESKNFTPNPLDYSNTDVNGKLHEPMKQIHRHIDWNESTNVILRKIRCSDSQPGVLDKIFGEEYYLYGAHEESLLKGNPGEIIAQRNGAICRSTNDGAVWITHLKKKSNEKGIYFKLPAALVLKDKLNHIPEIPLNFDEAYNGITYREIWYEEKNEVGYLHFNFYNGAMSTEQCIRLKESFIKIKNKKIKVIVLMGGNDFWSNGIHLNIIENAKSPEDESWKNINAINDLIKEFILTDSHIVVSAMQGNSAAGGVIMSLASDFVYARKGIVLNPHYKKMGLYGSEYWTYLLPKKTGQSITVELIEKCLPINTRKAIEIGLIDNAFDSEEFLIRVSRIAENIAKSENFEYLLLTKKKNRLEDEKIKPLKNYRKEELEKMWINFYGQDTIYHMLRKAFVYKISCSQIK